MARTKATAVKGAKSTGGKGRKTKIMGRKIPVVDAAKVRKKRRLHPGTKALREIRRYQRGSELLIPRAPMGRLVREILQQFPITEVKKRGKELVEKEYVCRLEPGALEALREAAEIYLTQTMTAAGTATIHGKRVTLTPKDMHLALALKDDNFIPPNSMARRNVRSSVVDTPIVIPQAAAAEAESSDSSSE